MSLLPRSHTQFQLKSYWDNFFTKRNTPFEWYGQYTDLCHILHKYIKPTSKTLVVGCGNSALSEDMYDAGIVEMTNIDISEVVIKKMGARNFEKQPKMAFTQMDMLATSFTDGSFDCVLDKGTLDAIYSNTDDVTLSKVSQMWGEVGRVLKTGGRYICITLAQEHILKALLERFSSDWLLRTHKVALCDSGDSGRGGVGASLPVIVFVLTKMMSLLGKPTMKVLEVVGDDGKCVRCESVEGVSQFVKAAQQHAMFLHHLKDVHPGEPGVQLQLWSKNAACEEPRYTFTVIDIHKSNAKNGQFAIFIVPQGKEDDWIFSSDTGLRGLAEQSCYQRLVVVSMHRGHEYKDLHHVKQEVSGSSLSLIQHGVPDNVKLPILSTGEGVGCRVCQCEGVSSVSGRWRVEEVGGGEGMGKVRRFVFEDTCHLVQTEMRLKPDKTLQKKKKSKKKRSASASLPLHPDPSYLAFTHHRAMLAALALSPGVSSPGERVNDGVGSGGGRGGEGGGGRGVKKTVLIVGLGGGALPTFIQRYLPQFCVEVCELDGELVEVAEKWFGFERNASGISLHIGDGVEFVKKRAGKGREVLYTAIVLDVDSKHTHEGISSPPLTFVNPTFLTAARSLLAKDGIFITNMAARNEEMRLHVLHSLQQVFCTLVCLPLQEDTNDVVVGIQACPSKGIKCQNKFCIHQKETFFTDGVSESGSDSRTVPINNATSEGHPSSDSEVLTEDGVVDDAAKPKDSTSEKDRQCHSSSLSLRTWKSSSVGDCEDVRRRVCDLVSVIGDNGGDIEGLEQELTAFNMYKTH